MYNLLIVDDKEVFRREIQRMPYFRKNQDKFCIRFLAQNGVEALRILENEDVDIVLTDIRMPLLNGLDLLKEIKRLRLCRCTILLSEYSDFSYAKEGIINGAFDYIVKPVDDGKLRATFDRAYGFLRGFVDKDSIFSGSVESLVSGICGKPADVMRAIQATSGYIRRSSESLEEMCLLINRILDKINYTLCGNRPYLSNYLPLPQICRIASDLQEEAEALALYQCRVQMLNESLQKFNFNFSVAVINDICGYIVENIEKPCDIQTIANIFYVNKKYLSTLFYKETGVHYVDFVTTFKIERAKMLLTDSDLKIYQIADMLGFSDKDYFSKVFKKRTSLSPSSFTWDNEIARADFTQDNLLQHR